MLFLIGTSPYFKGRSARTNKARGGGCYCNFFPSSTSTHIWPTFSVWQYKFFLHPLLSKLPSLKERKLCGLSRVGNRNKRSFLLWKIWQNEKMCYCFFLPHLYCTVIKCNKSWEINYVLVFVWSMGFQKQFLFCVHKGIFTIWSPPLLNWLRDPVNVTAIKQTSPYPNRFSGQ